MSEQTSRHEALDLSYVQDSDARRALRTLHQQVMDRIDRQQMEIDALLETLLEKHVTSLGEFKRIVVRLQQNTARSGRIHEAIASTQTHPPHGLNQ